MSFAQRIPYAFAAVTAVVLLFVTFGLLSPNAVSLRGRIYAPSLDSSSPPIQGIRRAYATFISTRIQNEEDDDPYFTATRTLTYQLLHQPNTRTQLDIPILVLVPPHVSLLKRQKLVEEGATIVPVSLLQPQTNWLSPGSARWIDQLSKLHLFNMTDYDQILYLDGDMLLTKSLDGIWDEEIAHEIQWTNNDSSLIMPDEAALPPSYQLIGVSDTGGANHDYPPTEGNDLNGGFFMLRPDEQLFSYYRSVMELPNRFDSGLMEQSLLNYAHRRDGNMPWKAFPMGKWNCNWPNNKDVEGGAATLHDKFWDKRNEGWIDRELVEMWWRTQGRMEGYWQAKRDKFA